MLTGVAIRLMVAIRLWRWGIVVAIRRVAICWGAKSLWAWPVLRRWCLLEAYTISRRRVSLWWIWRLWRVRTLAIALMLLGAVATLAGEERHR